MSNVNFRYRFDAEGRETTWYWFRDAAIRETERWPNCKVADEDTGIVWTERVDGRYVKTYHDAKVETAQ